MAILPIMLNYKPYTLLHTYMALPRALIALQGFTEHGLARVGLGIIGLLIWERKIALKIAILKLKKPKALHSGL